MKSALPRASFVLVLVSALLLNGCNTANEIGEAPAPIPSAAFSMNTDVFNTTPAGKNVTGLYDNFFNAAVRVGLVSAVVKTHLIIPAALTAATVRAEPALSDGIFSWTATAGANDKPWSFKLTGDPNDSYVDWNMYITGTGATPSETYDNFSLFTARTNLNDHSGNWQLYYLIGGKRTHVLSADFVVNSETDKEITFSVPAGELDHAGDQVRYAVDGKDHSFFWKEAARNQETTITWNAETRIGSIVTPGFNSGAKACWDASLKNVACPQ